MIRKDVIIAILATFCLTTTLVIVLPTKSSPSAGEYDSWADINDDGKINMYDIGYTAQRFGASGESTKNVNVTNWPIANQQTVFWAQQYGTESPYYYASGFSQMHLTWRVAGLAEPENVTLGIWGHLINPDGSTDLYITVRTIVATHTNDMGVLTISVPSERFSFSVNFATGTIASVYLAFYLTYA